MLNEQQALDALGGLSQETRLRIVRLLVVAGPDGCSAGAIAKAVGASPSNVSFHLSQLERAGLVRSRRVARSIIYAAAVSVLADLITYLVNDCCSGHPERCGSACTTAAEAVETALDVLDPGIERGKRNVV